MPTAGCAFPRVGAFKETRARSCPRSVDKLSVGPAKKALLSHSSNNTNYVNMPTVQRLDCAIRSN